MINMNPIIRLFDARRLCIFLFVLASPQLSLAQDSMSCNDYSAAVIDANVSISPDAVMADWKRAASCLVQIVTSLSANVNGPNISEESSRQIVRATGILNTIVSLVEKSGAIEYIRSNDNLTFINVLAWSARGESADSRLNSTILLANIVDNNSICVILDHLYDDRYLDTEFGVNGRANLLAVSSVIAPWAYKENYENIIRMVKELRPAIESRKDLTKSNDLLRQICERLAFQDSYRDPNKKRLLPGPLRACSGYQPVWGGKGRLFYEMVNTDPAPAIIEACPPS